MAEQLAALEGTWTECGKGKMWSITQGWAVEKRSDGYEGKSFRLTTTKDGMVLWGSGNYSLDSSFQLGHSVAAWYDRSKLAFAWIRQVSKLEGLQGSWIETKVSHRQEKKWTIRDYEAEDGSTRKAHPLTEDAEGNVIWSGGAYTLDSSFEAGDETLTWIPDWTKGKHRTSTTWIRSQCAESKDIKDKVAGEKRISPEDGKAFTLQEMKTFYEGETDYVASRRTVNIWLECKPVSDRAQKLQPTPNASQSTAVKTGEMIWVPKQTAESAPEVKDDSNKGKDSSREVKHDTKRAKADTGTGQKTAQWVPKEVKDDSKTGKDDSREVKDDTKEVKVDAGTGQKKSQWSSQEDRTNHWKYGDSSDWDSSWWTQSSWDTPEKTQNGDKKWNATAEVQKGGKGKGWKHKQEAQADRAEETQKEGKTDRPWWNTVETQLDSTKDSWQPTYHRGQAETTIIDTNIEPKVAKDGWRPQLSGKSARDVLPAVIPTSAVGSNGSADGGKKIVFDKKTVFGLHRPAANWDNYKASAKSSGEGKGGKSSSGGKGGKSNKGWFSDKENSPAAGKGGKPLEVASDAGPPAEQRVDPRDGRTYTLAELKEFYAGSYSTVEILLYWEKCKVGWMPNEPGQGADKPQLDDVMNQCIEMAKNKAEADKEAEAPPAGVNKVAAKSAAATAKKAFKEVSEAQKKDLEAVAKEITSIAKGSLDGKSSAQKAEDPPGPPEPAPPVGPDPVMLPPPDFEEFPPGLILPVAKPQVPDHAREEPSSASSASKALSNKTDADAPGQPSKPEPVAEAEEPAGKEPGFVSYWLKKIKPGSKN